MKLIEWQLHQQSALQALGYKRWVLRTDLAAHQAQNYPRHIAKPAPTLPSAFGYPDNSTAPPAPVYRETPEPAPTPPSAVAAVEFNAPAGHLTLTRHFSLLQSETLRANWLLPPLTGFRQQLKFFAHDAESALLLDGLARVGMVAEAEGLKPLLQSALPDTLPESEAPLAPPLDKILVILGQSAWRAYQHRTTQPKIHYLPHPHHALHEGAAKKALWIALNELQSALAL